MTKQTPTSSSCPSAFLPVCDCGYEKDNGHAPTCPLYKEEDWYKGIINPKNIKLASQKANQAQRATFYQSCLKMLRQDIKKNFGPRCKDFQFGCITCEAWQLLDYLEGLLDIMK